MISSLLDLYKRHEVRHRSGRNHHAGRVCGGVAREAFQSLCHIHQFAQPRIVLHGAFRSGFCSMALSSVMCSSVGTIFAILSTSA